MKKLLIVAIIAMSCTKEKMPEPQKPVCYQCDIWANSGKYRMMYMGTYTSDSKEDTVFMDGGREINIKCLKQN